MVEVEPGLYEHPEFKGKIPLQFSIKATKKSK